jgi:hypothetical protein
LPECNRPTARDIVIQYSGGKAGDNRIEYQPGEHSIVASVLRIAPGSTWAIGTVALATAAPPSLLRVLDDLLWLSSVLLVLFSFGTLVWFVYWFFLRRMMRARGIANARLARILRENREEKQE